MSENLLEPGISDKGSYAVSSKLKEAIQLKNLSRNKLSKLSGISTTTTGDAVNGEKISLGTAEKIAIAMGMKTEDIFAVHKKSPALSDKSILNYKRCISTILTSAASNDLVDMNAAIMVKLPSKSEMKEAPSLSLKEVALLQALLAREDDLPTKTLILLGLHTGMRRSELCGLTWKKINFENRTILVNQTLKQVSGKGLVVSPTKTLKSNRIINMTDTLYEALSEYRHWWLEVKNKSYEWKDDNEFLFVYENGLPISPDTTSNWVTVFVKKHNSLFFTLKALRHTFISLLANQNIDVKTMQSLSGHSSMNILLNRYVHQVTDSQRNAMEKFERAIIDGISK